MKKEQNYTTYEEAAKREVVPKKWLPGNEMNTLIRERYKKIVRSHYRTWYGLCYVSAGATLLGGANPFIISQGMKIFLTSLAVAWCIAMLFIVVSLVISHDCDKHLQKIVPISVSTELCETPVSTVTQPSSISPSEVRLLCC